MASLIGVFGVLIAMVGAALILYGFFTMRKVVNAGRSPDAQIKGFPLLPPTSSQLRKAFREEYPGHIAGKLIGIGAGLIVAGLVITTASNSYNANHPS
ncbi:hypothetical protein [Terriglobus sp.]|uniref:hypothetical protein n=1 Tax=Terriglobus sp. TaxID=1889013 RepID=UPI003B00780A